ncbi:MAG: hypothetical protein WBN34_07785 [Woeseia sp.]
MKYLIAILAGIATGAALFALLLYFNPLIKVQTLSPIAVSNNNQFELSYEATPLESILWTDNGETNVRPRPPLVKELEEATIRNTRVIVTMLRSSRGGPAGVGVRFATPAEETGLLNGVYPVNSTWHIWLLQRGGLMIDQRENVWTLLRDVVLPAHMSSADSWRGSWYGILTSGPNADGTGIVLGGSGKLAGADGEAVEAMNAKAYSAETGPASMQGRLTLSMTPAAAEPSNAADLAVTTSR